jgi:hypothetical protein
MNNSGFRSGNLRHSTQGPSQRAISVEGSAQEGGGAAEGAGAVAMFQNVGKLENIRQIR